MGFVSLHPAAFYRDAQERGRRYYLSILQTLIEKIGTGANVSSEKFAAVPDFSPARWTWPEESTRGLFHASPTRQRGNPVNHFWLMDRVFPCLRCGLG
jgi:hypothetical protein